MKIIETLSDGNIPEEVLSETSIEGDERLYNLTCEAWEYLSPWQTMGKAVTISTNDGRLPYRIE